MKTVTRTVNGQTEIFSVSMLDPDRDEMPIFQDALTPEDILVSIATVMLFRNQDRLTFYNNQIIDEKIREIAAMMRSGYNYILETYFFWYTEEGIYEIVKDERGQILRENLVFRNPFPGREDADTSFTFDGVTYSISEIE